MNSTNEKMAVASLESMTLRELTDRYPETMPVLSRFGLDLCCGGGHRLGEALRLHEIDSQTALPQLMAAIAGS